jgi:hypothetical protein
MLSLLLQRTSNALHRTTALRTALSSSSTTYPTAFNTVGQLLRSSQGLQIQAQSSGIQSAMVWIFRTCSAQDLSQIMNGTIQRRIDRLPPFNRTPKPLPLLTQLFKLLKKSPAAYSQTLSLLSDDRIDELDLTSKCALVKALQISSGQTILTETENKVVATVLKSVHGEELKLLKNLLNDVGHKYNLHQLMFQTITEPWREDILLHFANQVAADDDGTKPIKVLSDIDDTLFSSWLDKRWPREIVYPGVRSFFVELTRYNDQKRLGKEEDEDTQQTNVTAMSSMIQQVEELLEEGHQEPGNATPPATTKALHGHPPATVEHPEELQSAEYLLVDRFRLLREKSLSVWMNDDTEEINGENIDFEEFHAAAEVAPQSNASGTVIANSNGGGGGINNNNNNNNNHVAPLEDVTYITARPHGYRGVVAALTRRRLRLAGLSDKPQVMLGDMTGLLGNKRIALKKFTNFVEFSCLFPEYNFVLVGDSGQGDAALGELIYNHYPSRLKGVFLHNISTNPATGDGGAKDYYSDNLGFHFFQTYIGSAVGAFENAILTSNSVVEISKATLEEFRIKKFPATKKGRALKHDRLMDMYNDLVEARRLLMCEQ